MKKQTKHLRKIQSKKRVQFREMEHLLKIYGFEINKTSGGSHWTLRHESIIDDTGLPEELPLWRPHGRKENFLNPKTKQIYLEYIEKIR